MSPTAAADRDRYVGASTPTDFTTDYKQIPAASFDTSNVLAWLQSPTANGFLFSPGFGSMLNTPNYKQSQPSSTPTPIVSTSFFFSDVASLPKQPQTPAGGISTGNNNIICISPLASKKQQQTPVDLKEIFASPAERKFRVSATGKDAPSLDAVVLAERDLMEDEDLNVLLQLASNTTPRGTGVFRSTPRKPLVTTKEEESNNNLPGLQLPMIGGRSGSGPKARLSQKSSKTDDFAPPQLGMRSNSATIPSTKEIYAGGNQHKKENGKKAIARSTSLPVSGYPLYPPPDHSSYYPIPLPNIPPGMPPGSMHISVGGKNPGKKSAKSGKNSPSCSSSYPDFHSAAYAPPHPHMYPPPPYGVMGYPYNTGHYPPPPRHLSMYGAAQQSTSSSQPNSKGNGNGPEIRPSSKHPPDSVGKKRSLPPDAEHIDGKSKRKKSLTPATNTPGKKKNKSPPLTDRAERQKAANTIQDLNAASGGKNDKAAALAAAILRGVTMRPSGKWQAQLYFAGKSRYIGVFDTREKAALAYEIAREKLKTGHVPGLDGASTENLVNQARKAAFDGVNERLSGGSK
jgi:AP2 domain